ncbi:hypothetical protein ABZU32_19545 [Sphaerisporangium sp. NPDC005288]|uniref:hypothetical protein n=1 Tax=Sphaerisporangium sp. NPDC005288 TaxID=3155114 RepID=UPI0033BBBBE3
MTVRDEDGRATPAGAQREDTAPGGRDAPARGFAGGRDTTADAPDAAAPGLAQRQETTPNGPHIGTRGSAGERETAVEGLIEGLARLARAHGGGPATSVLKDTRVTVVRAGGVVAKAHPPGTDEPALTARLRAASTLPGVLLPPLSTRPERLDGRLVTLWPAGEPVDPADPEGAPWESAAVLLARLHAAPPDAPALPPAGGPARLARAVALLDGLDGALAGPVATVLAAHRSLLPQITPSPDNRGSAPVGLDHERAPNPDDRGPAPVGLDHERAPNPDDRGPAPVGLDHRGAPDLDGTGPVPVRLDHEGAPDLDGRRSASGRLAHGDFHLGQVIRYQGEWLLIDVDDLGTGDPAWDLARPAAWYASGLLSPGLWERFLSAYLGAAGPALPAGDPWRELDMPARALTVQLAATAVAAAGAEGRPLDEVEQALVSSCGRIARAAAPQ